MGVRDLQLVTLFTEQAQQKPFHEYALWWLFAAKHLDFSDHPPALAFSNIISNTECLLPFTRRVPLSSLRQRSLFVSASLPRSFLTLYV